MTTTFANPTTELVQLTGSLTSDTITVTEPRVAEMIDIVLADPAAHAAEFLPAFRKYLAKIGNICVNLSDPDEAQAKRASTIPNISRIGQFINTHPLDFNMQHDEARDEITLNTLAIVLYEAREPSRSEKRALGPDPDYTLNTGPLVDDQGHFAATDVLLDRVRSGVIRSLDQVETGRYRGRFVPGEPTVTLTRVQAS